jgi:hypothetical protein
MPLPLNRGSAPEGSGGRFWLLPRQVRLAEHYHYYYCFTEGRTKVSEDNQNQQGQQGQNQQDHGGGSLGGVTDQAGQAVQGTQDTLGGVADKVQGLW